MIRDTKGILEVINGENYSEIIRVKTEEELREDLVKYLELDTEEDEDDLVKLNEYILDFEGENDYVICGEDFWGGQLITYKETLEQEKGNAVSNLDGEDENTNEILEAYYNEVGNRFLVEIDKKKFSEKIKEYSHENVENPYKDTLLSFVDRGIINELRAEGWNTKYLKDTVNGLNVCKSYGDVIEIYGYIVK